MQNKPTENNLLFRFLRMDGQLDQESRTIPVSFSSEQSVKRFDWMRGCYYNEILGHDEGNVDMQRLLDMGVALFNHNRDEVIGAIIEPELDVDGRKCNAKIRFDSDDFSETIYQKVRAGTLKGISVGYVINSFEEVAPGKKSADGRFEGPCKIARSWTPLEVSVVSVPADTSVGVGRSVNIPQEELEEFYAYKAERQKKADEQMLFARLDALKRELEILELEM